MSANDQADLVVLRPGGVVALGFREWYVAKFLRAKQMNKRSPGSDAIHFAGSLIGLAAIQGNR